MATAGSLKLREKLAQLNRNPELGQSSIQDDITHLEQDLQRREISNAQREADYCRRIDELDALIAKEKNLKENRGEHIFCLSFLEEDRCLTFAR